jgi:hypothetical protein
MIVKSGVLAALLLMAPVAAFAQAYAIQGIEHYLRVESSTTQGRRGPVVTGYVYNRYGHPVDGVRLVMETVDAGGQITSSRIVHVLGTIPVDGYGSFEAPAPAGGGAVRVRALSFEPIGRGGG